MTRATRSEAAGVNRTRIRQQAFLMLTLATMGAAIYTVANARSGALASREALTVLIVFFAGTVASVAGFAFSAIAGALLAHLYADPVEMVRIMLVSSISIQI